MGTARSVVLVSLVKRRKKMVNYPTELNFADPCQRYRGPTDDESKSFPAGVFLDLLEWEHYNAEIFLERQIEAFDSFAESHPGQENPYEDDVKAGTKRLKELPRLPQPPCGWVPDKK
jgi:hypothetical protein